MPIAHAISQHDHGDQRRDPRAVDDPGAGRRGRRCRCRTSAAPTAAAAPRTGAWPSPRRPGTARAAARSSGDDDDQRGQRAPDHQQRVARRSPRRSACAAGHGAACGGQRCGRLDHRSRILGSMAAWTMSTTRLATTYTRAMNSVTPRMAGVSRAGDRRRGVAAEPGPVEDRLDQERVDQRVGEHQRDRRGDRVPGQLHREPAEHRRARGSRARGPSARGSRRPCRAPGPGSCGRSARPGRRRRPGRAAADGRAMLPNIGQLPVSGASIRPNPVTWVSGWVNSRLGGVLAGHRQQVQPLGEDQLEDQRHPEDRHRHAEDRARP